MSKEISANPEQIKAINHGEGAIVVYACPGSGKSTVIAKRVDKLILNGIDPKRILVISYTKSSVSDMKEKVKTNGAEICTFHSLMYRIIRNINGYKQLKIIMDNERTRIIKELTVNKTQEIISAVQNEISLVKNDMIDINDYYSASVADGEFRSVYNRYEEIKREHGLIDFDDIQVICNKVLTEDEPLRKRIASQYSYIMIDEFQDINLIQYRFLELLMKDNENIMVVGDDDQSIYRFRGARKEFISDIASKYPNRKTVTLTTNYRSTSKIVGFANKLIEQNKNRHSKHMQSHGMETGAETKTKTKTEGQPVFLIETDNVYGEALSITEYILWANGKGTPYNDIAVLYRVNIQADAVADALLSRGIPCRMKDETPSIYSHWITKDLLAYLSLSVNRSDNDSFKRILNKPNRKINKIYGGDKTKDSLLEHYLDSGAVDSNVIGKLQNLEVDLNVIRKFPPSKALKYIYTRVDYKRHIEAFARLNGISASTLYDVYYMVSELAKGSDTINIFLSKVSDNKLSVNASDGVLLSSLHNAKGLEFDTVFIAGAHELLLPHENSKTHEQTEEELRLFYVGCTRAKRQLFISSYKLYRDIPTKITPFMSPFKFEKTKNKEIWKIN
jgi:DNA helicase-2/ATP-dependent DNA helicase PcrA